MSIIPNISPRESSYLTSYNTGLGNTLFQIATCYGLSKQYNMKIYYNYVIEYCNILKHKYGFNHGETILRNCKQTLDSGPILTIHEDNNKIVDINIINKIKSDSNNNYHIRGYLECVEYFIKYKDDIQNLFSIDDYSLNVIKQKYSVLFSDIETVSIHFRFNECSHSYDSLYYIEAIKQVNKTLKTNIVFLIFSDDISKVNIDELGLKADNTVFINLDYDYLSLWAISLCKHHISSKSTFSFWGTFLKSNTTNQTIIISPKNFVSDWYPDSIKL